MNAHAQRAAAIVHKPILGRDPILQEALERRTAELGTVAPLQVLAEARMLAAAREVVFGDRGEVVLECRLRVAQPL